MSSRDTRPPGAAWLGGTLTLLPNFHSAGDFDFLTASEPLALHILVRHLAGEDGVLVLAHKHVHQLLHNLHLALCKGDRARAWAPAGQEQTPGVSIPTQLCRGPGVTKGSPIPQLRAQGPPPALSLPPQLSPQGEPPALSLPPTVPHPPGVPSAAPSYRRPAAWRRPGNRLHRTCTPRRRPGCSG